LKIKPSKSIGNGVYIAHFQRIEEVEEEEEDEGALSDAALAAEPVKEAKPKKKKKKSKKKGLNFIQKNVERIALLDHAKRYHLSESERSLVDRLSNPSLYYKVKKEETSKSLPTLEKKDSNVSETQTSKTSSRTSIVKQEKSRPSNPFGFTQQEIEMYGIGLKRFYAPQHAAIRQLQTMEAQQAQDGGSKVEIWKYPVPNPVPWK
jgi:hypothetical protein